MAQILGDFREEILEESKIFMMEFLIHSLPLDKRKQARYLSLAFIGEYLANFFPVKEEDVKSFQKQLQIKSAVNYIANELLDNSIKFNYERGNYPLKFAVYLLEAELIIVASNCANARNLDNLREFVNELINSDIDELYFRQIEKGAEEKSEESRLGFLSILNDYSAKLGWKIETVSQQPEISTVTTMVQLAT